MMAFGMMLSSVHRTSDRVHRLLSDLGWLCDTASRHTDWVSQYDRPGPGVCAGGSLATSAVAFHDKSFCPSPGLDILRSILRPV